MNIAKEALTNKIYTILVLTDVVIRDPEIKNEDAVIYGRANGDRIACVSLRTSNENDKISWLNKREVLFTCLNEVMHTMENRSLHILKVYNERILQRQIWLLHA